VGIKKHLEYSQSALNILEEAFSRCLTAHRMANHLSSDDLLISNLVGIAIHAKSDKTIRNILSRTSNSAEMLVWLKGKIVTISQKQSSLKTMLKAESEIAVREMRKGKIADILDLEPDGEIWEKLPDEIPADSPKDLFSGKDFEYEKTKDGFVFRCRGKDLFKDEIHEYEFKVPK
jgi:hypothetical protein